MRRSRQGLGLEAALLEHGDETNNRGKQPGYECNFRPNITSFLIVCHSTALSPSITAIPSIIRREAIRRKSSFCRGFTASNGTSMRGVR